MDNNSQTNSTLGNGQLESFSARLLNSDSTQAIDITAAIVDISIYEDIFSKTLYGSVYIKDAINLLNGMENYKGNSFIPFPIVGEEILEIEYSLPNKQNAYWRFAVYGIKNILINENYKIREYVLEFCSEEQILDAVTLVQKSWQDLYSNMAKDILENYLSINKTTSSAPNIKGKKIKLANIEPTKGVQTIVMPRLSPLEALEFLAKRSLGEKYKSASYLFFENSVGFNFCDIESLIISGMKQLTADSINYTYYYQDPNISKSTTAENNNPVFKTIITMKQNNRFDTIDKLKNGYFESDILIFDYMNKTTVDTVFSFANTYTQLASLGDSSSANNSSQSVGGSVSYPENSTTFVYSVTSANNTQENQSIKTNSNIFSLLFNNVPSGSGSPPIRHSKLFYRTKDTSFTERPQDQPGDSFIEQVLTNRNSYFTRLRQNMYTIQTYGDTNIKAGDVILINIPEITGMTNPDVKYDKFLSGHFLIGSINHKITPATYSTLIDVYKNGFSQPVISKSGEETFASSSTDYIGGAN